MAFRDVIVALTEHWADVRECLGAKTAARLAAFAGELGETDPPDPRRKRLGAAIIQILLTLPEGHPVRCVLIASSTLSDPAAEPVDAARPGLPQAVFSCSGSRRRARQCRTSCRSVHLGETEFSRSHCWSRRRRRFI
ncbi:hypothetical protein [Sinosporangium siamense]|uniref:Uncharacterized protein n=1 Tax=Sinosporangium siamense TaxID=1367973 RepID=A0A919V2Z1_9ACTN|nr:hypothetical protein [Sinosporangium siamense]GII90435.1 hypothetical protein Ssi02_06660 [Sinosporangium siamense]